MNKSTVQEIILFFITSFTILKSGNYMFYLNNIKTFIDFGIVMIFFISLIFFINYFLRLISKLIRTLSF
jgi:hypothetical protein